MEKDNKPEAPSPTPLTADDYDRIRQAQAEAHAPPTWEEWFTNLIRALCAHSPSEVGGK